MTYRIGPALAVFAFAFICFVPNPALPIGGSTGLQAGQLLGLLSVPGFLLLGWLPRRHTQILALLLVPVFVAGYFAVLDGRAFSDQVVLNTIVATSLVLAILVPAGTMARRAYFVPLLVGAAAAIVLNALLGLYQLYSFSNDIFPLPGLYQNPSFLSVISTNPDSWALYVKRPFGIFPEPSAMAASTGPWLVLILALLLRPDVRPWGRRGVTALLVAALVAGAALIVASRSGYTAFLVAGCLLAALPAIKDAVLGMQHLKGLATVVGIVAVAVVLTLLALDHLASRVESETAGGGESWPLRFGSIVLGLQYLGTSVPDLLVGAGPGQSSLALESIGAVGAGLDGEVGKPAVWSVAGTYMQEAGLLGVAALAVAMTAVVRAIASSSAPFVGSVCLLAWLGSVTVTTSYLSLLPVWLFFASLLAWDRMFQRDVGDRRLIPTASAGG